MRFSRHILAILILGLAAGAAFATPIEWVLAPTATAGCCPEGNGNVQGSFKYDWATNTYSDWNFVVSGFTGEVADLNATLTPATATLVLGDSQFVYLHYVGEPRAYLGLSFGYYTSFVFVPTPLTSFGGTVATSLSNVLFSASFSSFNANGQSFVSSVPEPVFGVAVVIAATLLCTSKKWGTRGKVPPSSA